MHYIPDLLQKKPFVFPEAPRWFRDAFYFCDIDAGTLYRIGADGTAQAIYVHGSPVSGWVRLDDGSLLVVAGLERRIVSVRDGVARTFADATGLVGWALNDLLRAPDGTVTSAPSTSTSLPTRARSASPARWCTSRRMAAQPSRRARSCFPTA